MSALPPFHLAFPVTSLEKARALRAMGVAPYPNKYERTHTLGLTGGSRRVRASAHERPE